MLRIKAVVGVTFLAVSCLSGPETARSQTEPPPPDQTLKVVTRVIEPLVVQQGDTLTGFSIDVWKEIARREGLRYEYITVDSVKEMLDQLAAGQADVAIAAVSMTPERELQYDFSHSYLQSGLQIMTAVRTGSIMDSVRSIEWGDVVMIIGFMFLLVLIFAHLIWLTERSHNPEFPKGYLRGVGEGIWWAVVTVVTVGYGDRTPKRALGRVVAIIWMFGSVFLVANITAAITSRLTLQTLQTQVSSVSDLPGRRVVTVANTTADQYLSANAIGHGTVTNVEDAYAMLEAGQADAVVFDAPILNHYASNGGQGKVRMVGEVFKPEPYGIALQRGSPYRESINRAILGIFTDGTYQDLSRRWFGTE